MPHVEVGQGPLALPKCSPQAHPPRQAALATNRVCCGPLRRRAPRNFSQTFILVLSPWPLISSGLRGNMTTRNYRLRYASPTYSRPHLPACTMCHTAAGEDPAQLPGRRVRRTDGHTRDCTVYTLVSDRSVLVSRRRQPLPPLARQSRGLAAPLLPQAECAARQVVISCRDNCVMPLAVEQYPSLRRRSTREARRGRAECG